MSILFSDYDGTFANKPENIKINCDKIRDYMSMGNIFVLSSGRSFNSLIQKTEEYKIPYDYLACCDGSYLFDKNDNLLMSHKMSHDAVSQVYDLRDLAICDRVDYTYEKDYSIVYDSDKDIASISIVLDNLDRTDAFVEKFLQLKKEHPEYDYVVYGFNNISYYMIKAKGISKSSPIEFLKEKLDIPKSEIFTVGDGLNDLEMIRDYNGFMIGNEKELEDIALGKYDSVYGLVDDIIKKKVKRR